MDEVETIQQYLLTQAGPDTDVILGLGYDESLGDDISVTIIATGFEQKSPFGETKPIENKSTQEEKIMFTLDIAPKPIAEPVKLIVEEPVVELDEVLEEEKIEEVEIAETIPTLELVTEEQVEEEKVIEIVSIEEEKPIVIEFDLGATSLADQISEELIEEPLAVKEPSQDEITAIKEDILERTTGFLVKPAIIYAEEVAEVLPIKAEEPVVEAPAPVVEETIIEEIVSEVEEAPVSIVQSVDEVKEEEDMMQIVYHEEIETVAPSPVAVAEEPVIPIATQVDSPMAAFDEAEAQKLRAAERLYKLRNLSFNFNAADPNNEYDSIPAYVRHNLQVHNTTLASVEKFYSSYSVGTDEQNNTQISTINTFLEGKKPD